MKQFRGSFSGRERDVFFLNPKNDEAFFSVGYGLGLDFIDDGRAFAPIDFDQDGDLDIVRVSLTRLQLLENQLEAKHHNFARIKLKATQSHAYALGAEVVLEAKGVTQRDYVKYTAGFQTQVSQILHFGLGDVKQIEILTVHWPSGTKQVFADLPVNRLIFIEEGIDEPVIRKLNSWPKPKGQRRNLRASLDHELKDLQSRASKLDKKDGRPTLVNFWAPWCKPCQKELPILAKLSREHANIRFVGISVEKKNLDSIKKSLNHFEIDYEQFLASESLLSSFFGTDSEALLPSTFLFDAQGRLSRAFLHAVGEDEIEASIKQLKPLPFNAQLMLPLGEEALAKGEFEKAIRYLKRGLAANPKDPPLLAHLGWAYSQQNKHELAISTLLKASQIDPNFPYAWYALGVAYKRRGQPTKAVEAIEKALHFQAEVAKYWMTLGAACSQAGDLKCGQSAFERVVALVPHSTDGWLNLGKTKILRNQGNGSKEFRRVLQINPSHRAARALLDKYGGASK